MPETSALQAPLVSVCIPTYQRAERLRKAVTRLLQCSYARLEIIISDNGSSDHTEEVCAELRRMEPSIQYFRHPQNMGPTPNFEFARSRARGKYFMWLGDDDFLDPDYISKCVAELERDDGLILVAGVAAYHRQDGVITALGNVIQPRHGSPMARVLDYVFSVEDNSIFYGIYRREAVADCTLPNRLAGDWCWMAEVLCAGRGLVLTSSHVYRELGDGTSESSRRIVRTLGLPGWQASIPWLVRPFNLALHVAWRSQAYGHSGRLRRAGVYCIILAVALVKHFLHMVLPKLPWGRRLYKRLFLSNEPLPQKTVN